MQRKQIIAVISAYGVMSESDNHYRVLIHAENEEEFKSKLKAFMLGETERACSNSEIARELGTVNPQVVYEAIASLDFPEEEGSRIVLEVPELCTDYHVENPEIIAQTSPDDDISAWRNAIIMTEFGTECFGRSEFPSVVAVYDPASEKDEEGNAILQEYTDLHHGTLMMTSSELESHLLGWERHIIPVM